MRINRFNGIVIGSINAITLLLESMAVRHHQFGIHLLRWYSIHWVVLYACCYLFFCLHSGVHIGIQYMRMFLLVCNYVNGQASRP